MKKGVFLKSKYFARNLNPMFPGLVEGFRYFQLQIRILHARLCTLPAGIAQGSRIRREHYKTIISLHRNMLGSKSWGLSTDSRFREGLGNPWRLVGKS